MTEEDEISLLTVAGRLGKYLIKSVDEALDDPEQSEILKNQIVGAVKQASGNALSSIASGLASELRHEIEDDSEENKAKNILLAAVAGALESGSDESNGTQVIRAVVLDSGVGSDNPAHPDNQPIRPIPTAPPPPTRFEDLKCSSCDTIINDEPNFCPNCGEDLNQLEDNEVAIG